MPKTKQTPGIVLSAMLEQFNLNYNRLAKSIGISSAMVRLIVRDENPISAPVALRLAKFFKTTPQYWLTLQTDFDISKAEADKVLIGELKEIVTADKVVFIRKKRVTKKASAADKKPVAKKAAKAVRGKPAKSAAPKKTVAKKPVAKKPAAKKPAAPKKAPAAATSKGAINEPQI